MQINLGFTCRECGETNTFPTDTADYGILYPAPVEAMAEVHQPKVIRLVCACGHISGVIGLAYTHPAEVE